MASLPAAEGEYDFVEKPSEDFYCPVTLDFLREPQQMLCCGNHLSQEAVTKLQGQPCPVCKEKNLRTVADKFFKRKVNEFKVRCRNKSLGCEWVGELGDLDRHLEETCSPQVIKCEFSYAGCEFECQRKRMCTHLDENVKDHLTKIACRTRQVIQQQQSQIDALKAALSRVPFVPGPSVDIVMTNFNENKKENDWWMGPPFYSHIGGYKMCLGVAANGNGSCKGTHVSVFVHLLQGEHDDQLKWPFRGDITLQLLNQRRDEGHLVKTIEYDDATGDQHAGRVVEESESGLSALGWGCQLIAHSKLHTEDEEYLKNDCLKFRISKVVVRSI